MTNFLAFTIVGIVTGSIYAIAASGLVVTYTTSGIFNFAHGAIGMLMAFLYWQLKDDLGLPTVVALLVVVFVAAPLFGALIERLLMRRLHGSSTGVALVVTVGLLILVFGAASTIWVGTIKRTTAPFFPGDSIELAGVVISYHRIVVLILAAAVAFGLRVLLFRTRIGVAMRAVVDDRELAAQNGAFPERVSQLAWALGSMLAAIAGILLAPELSLSHIGLTLLVINGYAAAMLGRLRSLPLTFAGALIIGLLQAYLVGYGTRYHWGEGWIGNGSLLVELKPVLPVLFLFVILVALPQARLRAGRVVGASMPRLPSVPQSLAGGAALVAVAAILSSRLAEDWQLHVATALAVSIAALSLVLLTGYGGQVSLCQFAFVGIGAVVMGKVAPGGGVGGLVMAALIPAVLGALIALPALRLQDLYLALWTLAIALLADEVFFDHPKVFENGSNVPVGRLSPFGLSLEGGRAQIVFLAVVFAAIAAAVLAIRSGPFGRRLAAMRDSPAACATLGMNMVTTKVAVFALSAAIAGLAGALYGGVRGTAGGIDFNMLQSLLVFLLVMLGGVTSATGALIAGFVFAVLPVAQSEWFPDIELTGLFIGAGAILISRHPNGFAGLLFGAFGRLGGRPGAADADVAGVAPVPLELEAA